MVRPGRGVNGLVGGTRWSSGGVGLRRVIGIVGAFEIGFSYQVMRSHHCGMFGTLGQFELLFGPEDVPGFLVFRLRRYGILHFLSFVAAAAA